MAGAPIIDPNKKDEEKTNGVIGFKEGQVGIPGVNEAPFGTPVEAELVTDEAPEEGIIDEPHTETPAEPTFETAVVDGDAIDGGDGETVSDIFDGLDGDAIKDEIAKNSEKGREYLKEISNRRDLEGITGTADKYLSSIGFSTISEPSNDTTLVSNEVALSVADRLLAGDKEFEQLGLAPSQVTDPDRVKRFFTSLGYSAEQTTAIQNAIDTRLQEQRIAGEGETMAEKKQTELDKRVAREQADIKKSVEQSQNLLQRQRALRGVGLSTATESDIAELKEQGDALMSAATSKANTEMALYQAQLDGAEAETITALQKRMSDATQTLNEGILAQADLTNKLVAQGKMEADMAFDNILETLKVGGTDVEGADKFTSESTGFLTDKYGNAILVDGKKVPIGGTTEAQLSTITAYTNMLKSEGVGKISTVPAALKDKVMAAYDLYAQSQSLSNDEEGAGLGLLKKLQISTTEKNIRRASTLIRDNGLDKATEMMRGINADTKGSLMDAFDNVAGGLSESGAAAARLIIEGRITEGDTNGAIDKLVSSIDDGLSTGVQGKIEAEKVILRDVSSWLQKYAAAIDKNPELAKGSRMGQTWEETLQLLNKTGNKELASLMTDMHTTLQAYRKNLSGAAFSKEEAAEYAAIFPGPFKSMELNEAKIGTLLNKSRRHIDEFYKDKIKGPYDDLFPEGIHTRFDPLAPIKSGGEDNFEGISDEMTDEEIINQIKGGDTTNIDVSDDTQLDSYLDNDFNSADQPAESKDIPETGFTENINIARTGTNVAKDTNNPGNITADSIPAGTTKEAYAKLIGATGTYTSPNGREYFVFPNTDAGGKALLRDITAKIEGRSKNISPEDTLARFQRVYVGETNSNYLAVLKKLTGANDDTPIKNINPDLLTKAVMKAEGFNS